MEGDKEKIWLVIDANIVFSALIKDDSLTGKIIFSDRFSLFFPEDGLIELNKYEPYISYIALALKLNCPIWSNDTDLKQQDRIKVYNTKELLEEFKNLK